MRPQDVRPQKWLWDENYPPRVLFDNEIYSAIWGKYENNKGLGIRFNATENHDTGYPNLGGNPTWFVIPDDLHYPLLTHFLVNATLENQLDFIENIRFAMLESNTPN